MTARLPKPQNFLILGTQRSGSQAIYFGLNQHPEVVCGGEWTFNAPWYQKIRKAEEALAGDFEQCLIRRPDLQERYSNAVTHEIRWLGFKILFRSSAKWLGHPALAPALWVDRLEGHLDWLRRRSDIQVIQLVRRDPVGWLKSKYLARATGSTTKEYAAGIRVRIPVGPAIRALATKRHVDERLSSLVDSNPYHLVYYEDFALDNQKALESCLAFIGCDPVRLPIGAPAKRRQSNSPAADYTENFDELMTALYK